MEGAVKVRLSRARVCVCLTVKFRALVVGLQASTAGVQSPTHPVQFVNHPALHTTRAVRMKAK